jgi:hypothetical protein
VLAGLIFMTHTRSSAKSGRMFWFIRERFIGSYLLPLMNFKWVGGHEG